MGVMANADTMQPIGPDNMLSLHHAIVLYEASDAMRQGFLNMSNNRSREWNHGFAYQEAFLGEQHSTSSPPVALERYLRQAEPLKRHIRQTAAKVKRHFRQTPSMTTSTFYFRGRK